MNEVKNKWRAITVRVPPFLSLVLVIAYAILACVVLTTDRLAKGWLGMAFYAVGCVLVFLAFARKRKTAGREFPVTADQAQDEQAAQTSPVDSFERMEKIREKIRMRKSDGLSERG